MVYLINIFYIYCNLLTHFTPVISFDTPWKCQKATGFLIFSGVIKRDQCHEIGSGVLFPGYVSAFYSENSSFYQSMSTKNEIENA